MQLHVRMAPRDPAESHRGSTPLELFFDLTFVVAIAQAATSLHHSLVEGNTGDALVGFPLAFFGIWWAWMNFTWFASAYDTDDIVYRLAVFLQMTGVLILAAGIPRAIEDQDFGVAVLGYVVMRLVLVGQWLRVAASHPEGRATAHRFAAGIAILQVGWVVRLALPDGLGLVAFVVLGLGELLVPVWAESPNRTPWHPAHIAERYGLFTIIVLGESVVAATVAVQVALDGDTPFGDLAPVVIGGPLILFSMWCVYFDMPTRRVVEVMQRGFADRTSSEAFVWGYGHYFVFASAAAAGTGLEVAVDQVTHHSQLTDLEAGFAITVPVALYLLTVWALHIRHKAPSRIRNYAVPIAAALILASSASAEPVLFTGVVLAALVVASVATYRERPRET